MRTTLITTLVLIMTAGVFPLWADTVPVATTQQTASTTQVKPVQTQAPAPTSSVAPAPSGSLMPAPAISQPSLQPPPPPPPILEPPVLPPPPPPVPVDLGTIITVSGSSVVVKLPGSSGPDAIFVDEDGDNIIDIVNTWDEEGHIHTVSLNDSNTAIDDEDAVWIDFQKIQERLGGT